MQSTLLVTQRYQSEVLRQRSDTRDELGIERRWCWWRCWWRSTPSRWEDRWWWRWRWFAPPRGKFPRQNSSAGALDWFRQGSASWQRSLVREDGLWFFPHWKTPYSRRWPSEGHQGAHEVGVIRLQRIYNFWLLHAILSTVLDYIGLYFPLLYYFWD